VLSVLYLDVAWERQSANAEAMVELGGGEVIAQSDLTPALLRDKLLPWLDLAHCETASRLIRQQSPQNATATIVERLLAIKG